MGFCPETKTQEQPHWPHSGICIGHFEVIFVQCSALSKFFMYLQVMVKFK